MDPYECHIEAHRIPAPTQLVSLVSRDCRNSYLRLPFAIFFLGHHHVFRRSMVVTSAFGDSFPPRFSFYCDLLPCDLLSCDWTGDDGGSKGNCYPSARSCQCGAVGPHDWLIILFFQWEKFLDTPPKEMWPAGMPLLVTQLYPQTSKLAGS